MIPAARLSAAIGVLDRILAGQPAEQALTNWGRANRYAGSGDRAAVRDLVFDALRCKRSFAHFGGGMTGRGLILGGMRAAGQDATALFTGIGHAPAALGPEDSARTAPMTRAEGLDIPDWLEGPLDASLGRDLDAVMMAMRSRAPVFLRVNLAKLDLPGAIAVLAGEGVAAQPHPLATSALHVTDGARKIQTTSAYLTGLVELQDAASQAVVEMVPLSDGIRVLDYCAGGGGKTLALAARASVDLFAHDADPRRMRDLPARAARAGVRVKITDNPDAKAPYGVILTDVPCSGSGSWRRDPAGKWALTPARLADLVAVQRGILDRVAPMVAHGGHLAYVTCSLLRVENADQIDAFLSRHSGWAETARRSFTPLDGGDGFFCAVLRRE
jgi:16S rRNA (cytosine967-C5)-methyltransferase